MRILVFSYDFPHRKSVEGFSWLCAHGRLPVTSIHAPFRELQVNRPTQKANVPMLEALHPTRFAETLGIDARVAKHNDPKLVDWLKSERPELGIVLGSRILSQEVISCFRLGILNMHPGVLPSNRGLETVRHAILRSIPQGVSAHLISNQIDRGRLIEARLVSAVEGDSIRDLDARVTAAEFPLMISAINKLEHEAHPQWSSIGKGVYNVALTRADEERAEHELPNYVRNYADLIEQFADALPTELKGRYSLASRGVV